MTLSLAELADVRALRAVVALEPVDGPGGRMFPMTALGERNEPRHVVEEGPDGRRVLVDSCASQANRQEAALLAARDQGRIELADIVVDLSGTAAAERRPRLSTLEMPHRIADAILRDSEIDGVPFPRSELGRRILGASLRDLSPILATSPASLVFGAWFSQHGLGTWGLKLERASVSEIWGHGAQLGKAVGSRLDPLGLIDLEIYRARDGGWTADPEQAERDSKNNKPIRYVPPNKPNAKGKTTELNHSNVPPTIMERGVMCARYELRWSLNAAVLRRYGFGGPEVRDAAARRYLMALGLAARVLAHEDGYALRSRCHLLARGPLEVEAIGRDGEVAEHQVEAEAALALLRQAQAGLVATGFPAPAIRTAAPGRRLADLIAKSHEATAAAAAAEVA